jgi:hemolysin-activating ACP:hemolysin acyltransferase
MILKTSPLSVVTCELNDRNLMSVAWLVSRLPPFNTYSFGLMMDRLYEQLLLKNNVAVVEDGKIVAYSGWIFVNEADAELWLSENQTELPTQVIDGNAVIVTVFVIQDSHYLRPLIKGMSEKRCNKNIFRKRTFNDGRSDVWRPPIKGLRYN